MSNRLFDFGGLATGAGETVVLERKISVEGTTEGTLLVAIHAIKLTGAARIIIDVDAVSPDTDEPQVDYVGRTIASVGLDSSDGPGTLRLDNFSAPWGKWVQISVRAANAAPPATFSCRLTAELVLKSPAAEDRREMAVPRASAITPTPWVLRVKSCVEDPGTAYVLERVGPVETPSPPSWSLDLDELLSWLPRIAAEDRCMRTQTCEPRPERKVVEQVVTVLPRASLDSDAAVRFCDDRPLEPTLMVPFGDALLVLWESWVEDGHRTRGGAVKPRVDVASLAQFGKWTARLRGQPRIAAVAPLQHDEGDGPRCAIGLSRWSHSILDLEIDVPAEALRARLSELARDGLRPRSITAYGRHFARRYAIVAEEDHRPWEVVEAVGRCEVAEVTSAARSRGCVPACLAELGTDQFMCILVRDEARVRPTPRGHIEFDVSEQELRSTLEAFSCDGWRLMSMLPSPTRGLHLLWVEELCVDATLSGVQFEDRV